MKAKRQTKRPEDINAALARKKGPVSKFIARHYRHFNAAALLCDPNDSAMAGPAPGRPKVGDR